MSLSSAIAAVVAELARQNPRSGLAVTLLLLQLAAVDDDADNAHGDCLAMGVPGCCLLHFSVRTGFDISRRSKQEMMPLCNIE